MNPTENTNLDDVVKKLHYDYEELRIEIDGLLKQNNKKVKPRVIGALTSAGNTVEKLLLYIIKKEGRQDQLKNLEGKFQGLSEIRKIVKDIIPKQQDIHLGTIHHWRNLVAHANDHDKVDEHELVSVNAALKSFVEWFFEGYLLGEYADFTNNQYSSKEIVKDSTIEAEQIKENLKKDTLNIPDYSVLSKSKEKRKKKNKISIAFSALLIVAALCLVYQFYFKSAASETHNSIGINKPMNKQEMYQFIRNYFNSFNDRNEDPHRFFANKILRFYSKKNLNPTQAIILRRTSDFIQNEHAIDLESLYLHSKNDSISYWRFWNDFVCYRPSRSEYQKCKVQMEFGINIANKIISITEITFTKPRYYKKKPA